MNDFGAPPTPIGANIKRRVRPDTSWGVGPWPVQTPDLEGDRPTVPATPPDGQEPRDGQERSDGQERRDWREPPDGQEQRDRQEPQTHSTDST